MDYILEKGDLLYKSINVHTPLCTDELPRHVNIEGCSSEEQGNISNNITTDFLKVSLNIGNGLILLMATHLHSFGANKDFSYLIRTVDLLKVL